MPDINDKYVLFYAPKGYGNSLTVTISIYDTAGTAEINAQSMTELGNTGIYYFNWFPKKRTAYLALMDCAERPYKSHQVIRIEKTKLAGAVSIPKIAFPPKTWSLKEKELIINNIKGIKKNQSEADENQLNILENIDEKERVNHSVLFKEVNEIKNNMSSLKRNTSELIESGLKDLNSENNRTILNNETILNTFESVKKTFIDETGKLSKSNINQVLKQLTEKITELSIMADETNANLRLSNDLFSGDIKEKINRLSSQTDELIILLKNASN